MPDPNETAMVAEVNKRLVRLESFIGRLFGMRDGFPDVLRSVEVPVEPWKYLVARPHPWRRQLYIKGRNMTVRHLLGSVKANRMSPEEAAKDLDLPLAAVQEALAYAEIHRELLETEAELERLISEAVEPSCR